MFCGWTLTPGHKIYVGSNLEHTSGLKYNSCDVANIRLVTLEDIVYFGLISAGTYSLPSINVNPWEWIKVNIYRGVNI